MTPPAAPSERRTRDSPQRRRAGSRNRNRRFVLVLVPTSQGLRRGKPHARARQSEATAASCSCSRCRDQCGRFWCFVLQVSSDSVPPSKTDKETGQSCQFHSFVVSLVRTHFLAMQDSARWGGGRVRSPERTVRIARAELTTSL